MLKGEDGGWLRWTCAKHFALNLELRDKVVERNVTGSEDEYLLHGDDTCELYIGIYIYKGVGCDGMWGNTSIDIGRKKYIWGNQFLTKNVSFFSYTLLLHFVFFPFFLSFWVCLRLWWCLYLILSPRVYFVIFSYPYYQGGAATRHTIWRFASVHFRPPGSQGPWSPPRHSASALHAWVTSFFFLHKKTSILLCSIFRKQHILFPPTCPAVWLTEASNTLELRIRFVHRAMVLRRWGPNSRADDSITSVRACMA